MRSRRSARKARSNTTVAERTVVICPWHNYEFDIATGRSPCDPERLRIQTYRVELDGEDVVVYV